jgi:hypothetical protein
MKLPSRLVIQNEKLTKYLLVYQAKDDKSQYLAEYGYTLQNWQILKQDILKAVEQVEVDEVTSTDWGIRYKIKTHWDSINRKQLKVITVWQQDEGSDTPKFITLYPNKSRED